MRRSWKGGGRTAAPGMQTYQSRGIGFASILETQPRAVPLGCLFLVRKCGVGVCREVLDGVDLTYWLSESSRLLLGKLSFVVPRVRKSCFCSNPWLA